MSTSSDAGNAEPKPALTHDLGRYDADALWTLICAAGAAPGVRHRWATVGHLLAAALRARQDGTRSPVAADDLQHLLDACVTDEPRLTQLEDFVPKDPRDDVVIRVGDTFWRLFPGSIERPIADVRRALLVAEATDEVLVARLGFGVKDLITAAVTFIDHAVSVMSPAWPTVELAGDGPVMLTDAELDTAAAVDLATTPEALGLSERQIRALTWATGDLDELPYEPDHPQSPFGRYLRVARHGAAAPASWMPLSHIPEILGYAVVELAQEVADEPRVRLAFAQAAASAARRALWRFSSMILGAPDRTFGPLVSPGNCVQWVSMLGPGRGVLVQLVSELDADDLSFEELPAALRVARDAQADAADPVEIPMPGGAMNLDRDIELVPLLVVANAGHIAVPQNPGLPAMSLDDLLWASTNATADSDLFLYCRDLARPDSPPFFGWESINVWEWWQANGKTLFAGGLPPTFMSIAPHAGDAEWDRARDLAELERALAKLALPGLHNVDGVDHKRSGPPEIFQWVDPQTLTPGPDRTTATQRGTHLRGDLVGWSIHLSDVPVAILSAHPTWSQPYEALLHDLAGGFAFGFRQIDEAWRTGHAGHPVRGYIIDLVETDRDDAPIMAVTTVDATSTATGDLVRANVAVRPDALATEADRDGITVRQAMAATIGDIVIAAGLPDAAESINASWDAAPPTIAVRVMSQPTVRNDLPSPIKLEPALLAEVDRAVAGALRNSGVEPGTYLGEAAKALDRDELAPASLQVLTDRLKAFAMDEVVLVGMREIERSIADREQQARNLEQAARLLHLDWDPVQHHAEMQRDHLMLRRSSEVAVEAALRFQPNGDRPVDRVAWAEVAAAANAYLSATMRSEHVHHQVRPTGLKITESYEIHVIDDAGSESAAANPGTGRVYDLDMDALQRAQATQWLGNPADQGEPDEVPAEAGTDTGGVPAPLVDPALDTAMRDAFGASGSDIQTTLFGLAHWPLTDEDDDVIATSRQTIVDHVLESTILGEEGDGSARVEHVINLLNSTSQGLATGEWKPWHARSRRRRLVIQPLPTLSDGRLVVAPHLCLAALTAYRNQLDQGQLPWSQPAPDEPPLPRAVTAALEAVREARNRALEKRASRVLRDAGWLVVENIKKGDPQRLSIPSLSGEVDIVAGQSGAGTVWLLEVKDPADTYVVPEVRRHLDTFFVDRDKKLSYATRLRHKVEDLQPHVDAVAAALGLPPRHQGYKLAAAFVTRKPVPAAYVTNEIQFTSVPELPSALTAEPQRSDGEPPHQSGLSDQRWI